MWVAIAHKMGACLVIDVGANAPNQIRKGLFKHGWLALFQSVLHKIKSTCNTNPKPAPAACKRNKQATRTGTRTRTRTKPEKGAKRLFVVVASHTHAHNTVYRTLFNSLTTAAQPVHQKYSHSHAHSLALTLTLTLTHSLEQSSPVVVRAQGRMNDVTTGKVDFLLHKQKQGKANKRVLGEMRHFLHLMLRVANRGKLFQACILPLCLDGSASQQ